MREEPKGMWESASVWQKAAFFAFVACKMSGLAAAGLIVASLGAPDIASLAKLQLIVTGVLWLTIMGFLITHGVVKRRNLPRAQVVQQ